MKLKVVDVLEACQGTLLQGDAQKDITGVCFDTRKIQSDELFVALVAERDGHDFIPAALKGGAGALLVSRSDLRDIPEGVSVVQVADTLDALGQLAAFYRQRFQKEYQLGGIAAVTGSNGKTTTKEMLARILSQCGPTLYTEGNFNNLIGLPLTVFRLEEAHQFAVLEMGMNAPGEIAQLAKMGGPDVGIITNVAAAHLEGLGSIEGVAKAKGELFDALTSENTAVINADDPHILEMGRKLTCKKIYFSSKTQPEPETPTDGLFFYPEALETLGVEGSRFQVKWPEKPAFKVQLPLLGPHQVSNAMAALSAAYALGATPEAVQEGLSMVVPTGRRMRLVQANAGIQMLDDCYNSNPSSCLAALKTLKDLRGDAPSFVVFGDMLEMGEHAQRVHTDVGRYVAELGASRLFAFGSASADMCVGAKEAGMDAELVQHFTDIEDLWSALQPHLKPDSWVLIKGSRGMRLERISQKIEALS